MAVAGAVALCALGASASAQAAVDFEKHGTLSITTGKSFEPISSTYEGPFPDMRRREFVAYAIWQSGPEGPQPENCNNYPPLDVNFEQRKYRVATWSVFESSGSGDPPTSWCPGEWRAAAFVYKLKDGVGVPRLQFAKKKFQVGGA